ncbi:MAG: LysR family transcriptional regulator [Methyloligellaceae bacterium]
MDLRWLEDFVCLARTNSFSRAAEQRFVTQSAFSRRIKALESWLGVRLVDRSGYPTRLTEAGLEFLAVAEEVGRQIHEIRDHLGHRYRKDVKTVSFAAPHTVSLSYLPDFVKRLEACVGPVNTRVSSDNVHNCIQALLDGSCDFLLGFSLPDLPLWIDPDHFAYHLIGRERLVPVSAPASGGGAAFALPGRAGMPTDCLAYQADSFLGRAVDGVLSHRTAHLNVRHANSFADALRAMALAGLGLAWLPESLIASHLAAGELVSAGGPEWETELELRLYKANDNARHEVLKVWRTIERDF